MAKNRNKKKKNGVSAMDISTQNQEELPQDSEDTEVNIKLSKGKKGERMFTIMDGLTKRFIDLCIEEVESEGYFSWSHIRNALNTMDTTETTAPKVHGVLNRKIKKGVSVRRSKSVRKMKAIERAISIIEKKEEKILKSGNKTSRTQSAKTLYE